MSIFSNNPSHHKQAATSFLLIKTRHILIGCFFLVASLGIALPSNVLAEKVSTEEWNISADTVVRFEKPSSIVAKGNVVLEKKELRPVKPPKKKSLYSSWAELLGEEPEEPEMVADDVEKEVKPKYKTTVTIRADWIVYDVELQSIKAKGNLEITTKDEQLYAKEGILNLTNETGDFKEATVRSKEKSLHMEGKSIEKTGFDTYRIIDGWAITCKIEKDETPPWSFSSSKVDIRQGGYAILKHARFNIRNVPVLYSPYMIIPVKNTRQTGFLLPEIFSSSSGGFGFNLPFFLNISDSMDATFFPEYYLDRGFMPGVEFRYMAGKKNKGIFTASYLDDQLSDPSETDYYADTGYKHDNSERYWVRGKADYNFGSRWKSRLDIDIVSDQDYLQEFDTGTTGFEKTQDRYLDTFGRNFQNDTAKQRKNKLKLLRSWSGMSLEGEFLAINDARVNPSETNTPLWKLPRIDFTGDLPTGFADINFDWDADYVNYWREDGIGGNRVDLHPSLSAPIPISNYLETRAEIGLRDTFYVIEEYGDTEWDESSTQNRIIPNFEIETATTLERDFGSSDSAMGVLRHQIRPYLEYGYIPEVDQDDLPSFDDVDSISEKNKITYGVDNFLDTVKTRKNGLDKLKDYAQLQIEQSYDLRSEASDEPFSDIFSRFKWKPLRRTSIEYKTYYDVYDNRFDSHTFDGYYKNSRGDFLGLEYSFKRASDIEQINAFAGATFFDRWLIQGGVEHSISQEETVKANGSLTYQALCWSLKFETRYTPADITYLVMFNLANIGVPLGIDF